MSMANWVWSLTVIGWLVAPIITFFTNKLLSYLDFNLSRKLRELEFHLISSIKKIQEDATEQIILRAAEDGDYKGSGSDLKILRKLAKDLASTLYDAEDVPDLVDYRRIEKKVMGDEKPLGTSTISWVLHVFGDCIDFCKRSWLGQKLLQCAKNLDLKFWDLLPKLKQYAQNMNQMFRNPPVADKLVHQGAARPGQPSITPDAPSSSSAAEFTVDIEQGSATPAPTTPDDATSNSNPPTPDALPSSAGSATEFTGHNQQGSASTLDPPSNSLLQIIWDWFSYAFSAVSSFYLAVRRLRDWSYEAAGIKNDDDTATDYVLSTTERNSLRKMILNIEYIVSESKKSALLNQNSSSNNNPKDATKESSSSSSNSTVKNTAKEISSKQKEIDDLHRSIEKRVFGREADREHISMMLREEPSSSSKPYVVIGIYGITGSGKSTLAQYVCDYEKGEGHFSPIMFIHVGKTFSVADIFRDMLEQITRSMPSNDKGLKSLKSDLEEELKGKRFLLILDDLWANGENQKELDILLDTLSAAQSGSRILVTAQKTDAAAALGAQEQIAIRDLEEKVYMSLFMHHARPVAVDDDDGEYERIGSRIAEKLHRSPIAAVTVGKQLQMNKSLCFWETTAKLDVLNETMGALWWSYKQLGDDIKRCFAYCSTFPKGYALKRDELVRIWIALGFVNTRGNATEELEDVGQRYFDELLTFSFLQIQRHIFGMVTGAFTIHDLLHDLAERVIGSERFKAVSSDSPRDIHHLFVETNNATEIIENILDLENLRTLIVKEPRQWFEPTDPRNNLDIIGKPLERLFTRLTKLRVLIIELNYGTREWSIPASIDHMKHLRYLRVHFQGGRLNLILPSTFSKLYHLQIIDVPGSKVETCPKDMDHLIYLRHVIPEMWSFPNIGRLTSLQTLTHFTVRVKKGHELKQLKHLNKLRGAMRITSLGVVGSKEEALEAHLAKKKALRKLELWFDHDKRDPDVEAEVLEGLCPPKELEELVIRYYNGCRYPSWMMLSRQHPDTPKHLHTLHLFRCSQLAEIHEASELLIGLRELLIFGCEWDRLPENMERLISLQTLTIVLCNKIQLLPTLPNQSLERIQIGRCDVLSTTCKEEGHENWNKIQHIRDKYIKL